MLPSTSYHITRQQQKDHLTVSGGSEQELLRKGRAESSVKLELPRIGMTLAGLALVGITVARILGPSLSTQLESIYPVESNAQEVIAGGESFALGR